MVILVAVGLAFTSQQLKPTQKKNEDIDKMRQILRAINIASTDKDADKKYAEFISKTYVIDAKGTTIDGDAFGIEMVDEMDKAAADRHFPVYEAKVNGQTYYILALRGTGLWGPIWGYLSVKDDRNTVYGADFGHMGETPGLGAEIALPDFSSRFPGKTIFKEGVFKSIAIVKPGKTAVGQDYVDGISGGTITSQGVNAMLLESLKGYEAFLKPSPTQKNCDTNTGVCRIK